MLARLARCAVVLGLLPAGITHSQPAAPLRPYVDGHSRPTALVQNPRDGLLYVALSTADAIVAIDVSVRPARTVARIPSGPFPQALAVTATGEVIVACRYEPALGRIPPHPASVSVEQRYRRLPAGEVHGLRGLALSPHGELAYVAAPALDGVLAVRLDGGGVAQRITTGPGPRALRLIDSVMRPALRPRDAASEARPLLVVTHLNSRVVTAHEVAADGRLGPAVQRIETAAAAQDLLVVPEPAPTLLLLTHEDRRVDRSQPFVGGLDSVLLQLPLQAGALPFLDPGPGQRPSLNLTERPAGLAKLDAALYDAARGRLIVAGAATDNVWIGGPGALAAAAGEGGPLPGRTVTVGSNPTALALLADGRIAIAERLSDTVSLLDPQSGRSELVLVGAPDRKSPAERGELLFFSRQLFPRNVADGERSVYACSACHDDAHVDGRAHPARQNRFVSMTKTCRGIAQTAPYLFIGEMADLGSFADNLLASHAQGWERDPWNFDKYPVTIARHGPRPRVLLQPAAVRAAMAAYLATIPSEPSPFVPLEATVLPDAARRGLALFRRSCAPCHQLVRDTGGPSSKPIPEEDLERELLRGGVALTSSQRYSVGTRDLREGGNNPPSLRGAWENGPYFSDGSAATLGEVLRRTRPDPQAAAVHAPANAWPAPIFSDADRDALLAFLHCL